MRPAAKVTPSPDENERRTKRQNVESPARRNGVGNVGQLLQSAGQFSFKADSTNCGWGCSSIKTKNITVENSAVQKYAKKSKNEASRWNIALFFTHGGKEGTAGSAIFHFLYARASRHANDFGRRHLPDSKANESREKSIGKQTYVSR